MELVVGGAQVSPVAVHEVEPVVLPGDVALDPVDRLDEAAAVPGLDVGLAAQRLERGDPGRHRRREDELGAAVARDPELGRTFAGRLLPAPREQACSGEEECEPANHST